MSKKKFRVIMIILGIIFLVIIILVVNRLKNGPNNKFYIEDVYTANESFMAPSNNNLTSPSALPYDYYNRYNNQKPSISDTREFQKISYDASIDTRNVKKTVTNVKNVIRGADGRIDNLSTSKYYGDIGFVVAKSKFEKFKEEMESLTHEKLYTESISSENLLNDKQNIEENGKNITNLIKSYKEQKNTIIANHTQVVNSINKELVNIRKEISIIRSSLNITVDPEVIISLRNQENVLMNREEGQINSLKNENSNYAVQVNDLDSLINNENGNLANNNKQDNQLLDNVETVNGSVRIRFISLWALATVFSPISPVLIIIIIIIIICITLYRKNKIPKLILE